MPLPLRVDAKLDVRAVWMARLAAVPAQAIVPLIYPRLLPLHNLLERPEVCRECDQAGQGGEGGGKGMRGWVSECR